MTIKRNRLMRVAAGVTATAVVGSLGVFATANTVSAAPGDGGVELSQSSGDHTTNFNVGLVDAGSQTCPADAVTGNPGTSSENWRAGSFIAPVSTDPASLNFTGASLALLGAPDDGTASNTALPLVQSDASFAIASLPASPNGNIVLNDFSQINFNNVTGPLLPGDGVYNIGIACYDQDIAGLPSQRFWSTQITISNYVASPLSFDWVEGIPEEEPDAPVITGVNGTVASFTADVANPDITGFTATVTPTAPAGPALPPIPVLAGATSFNMPGLALGSSYEVSMIATNAIGDSPVSNIVTFTVQPPAPDVDATDIFDGDTATITWTVPAGPTPPDSYDVEILDDVAAVVQSFPGEVGTSVDVSGLAVGDYTAEVTANYPAGSGLVGPTGSDDFSVLNNALIVQEVSVTRPPGALIITQRCGVFGELPRFEAVDAFPGFPTTLPLVGATGDQVGTSPDIDLATAGVQPDPEFDNYPFPTPATYPTECGLDMGTASFVTSGALAGQFYAADGRLNEVTVLDTRDNDDGWVARGDIEDVFTGDSGDTFSGDYLGWEPVVTDDSDPVGGSAYDQTVTAGPQVLPGTVGGLTGNAELASAPAGSGLGIATLDARMLLLIPASADAADYNATLTLTVA